MKNGLLLLALMVGAQTAIAGAYSDAALSGAHAMSPFDRSYEAGRAQSINQPVDYQRTKPAALQIDLSADDPTISVEETETERVYRQTLAELERSQRDLHQAHQRTEEQLRVRFKYFWDLKDAQGNPSPMILLSDTNDRE